MDLYHSRLTLDDLNYLIIKYKIPYDLHPRLPSEDFVMSEIPDDDIGIYHRMFDFSGVRIPFSSFLLALIKHYRVHFSQLGPLGLNTVITFEVLCRSLQIEPTSGFFLIDRWAIPDDMVWRHTDAAIDDPRPSAGCFNMVDVCRLSAHVIKLMDMPEGVLVLSGLSRVWKSRVCDPVFRDAMEMWTGVEVQEQPHLDVRSTLQRLPFYCIPPAAAGAVIPEPTLKDLAAGTPSFKIVAKAEASHKSALAQSSGNTTSPSLFVGDDDDDACAEISLVTHLCSALVIPSSGNQGGRSAAPTVEGSNPQVTQAEVVQFEMLKFLQHQLFRSLEDWEVSSLQCMQRFQGTNNIFVSLNSYLHGYGVWQKVNTPYWEL
ncbi:hypothetical protein Tco_1305315 [Tanacetum coccineum]